MSDVSKKGPCKSPGGVDEWRIVISTSLDEEFRYVRLISCCESGPEEEVSKN